MIGLALFATNISCVHLVSLAQSGFDTGLLNGNFEWMAAFTLILLALFFVPFYIKSGVSTLPDFLEKRYNRACRDWLDVDMYISVTIIAILTGLYTILGGLRAVVITESIQTIVLLAGAILITFFAWQKLGGWDPMVEVLDSKNELSKLSMLRPHGDESGMPWYAIFLGYPILGIWYWCADQTIVQRVLGAKDENHARVGALFCGFIKILPVFIFVMPGLFAYVLAQKGLLDVSAVTSVNAQGEAVVNSKGIYTLMITQLIPTGLVGILVAAMLSGLMSQISGALNSISTLVSFDLYKRFKPDISDAHLVRVGRWSAGFAILVSIGLLPLLNSYVFVLGIFWKKASALSAQYTLWIGSILGILVFAFNKLSPSNPMASIPFMMMAFYLFCICMIIQIVLSYVFVVNHSSVSDTLYWKSFKEPLQGASWSGIGNYKTLSLILLSVMFVLYVIFQ